MDMSILQYKCITNYTFKHTQLNLNLLQEIQAIYNWMDEIQLSRPRRNIARDFSDGVLLAEVLHQYFPRLVSLICRY